MIGKEIHAKARKRKVRGEKKKEFYHGVTQRDAVLTDSLEFHGVVVMCHKILFLFNLFNIIVLNIV